MTNYTTKLTKRYYYLNGKVLYDIKSTTDGHTEHKTYLPTNSDNEEVTYITDEIEGKLSDNSFGNYKVKDTPFPVIKIVYSINNAYYAYYLWFQNLVQNGDNYETNKFAPNKEERNASTYGDIISNELGEYISDLVMRGYTTQNIMKQLPFYAIMKNKDENTYTISGKSGCKILDISTNMDISFPIIDEGTISEKVIETFAKKVKDYAASLQTEEYILDGDVTVKYKPKPTT